jgi:hypothetical protein
LGHGLDVYSSVTYTDPYTNTPEPTHDFVLMAWYQGGALFLIGDLICIAEGIRRMRMRGRGPTQGILLAGSVSVILFALQAPMLYSRYFWFPFVLATAYPMLSGRTSRSQPGEGELLAGQPA